MNKLSIRDVDLAGKRVFIRVDFNVPLDESGQVRDDTRIRESLPTIRLALEQDAKVILASHLGRPKGQVVPSMTLKPAAAKLSDWIGQPVPLAPDCVGPEAEAMVERLRPGQALMLENLRFHPGEEKNDPEFAAQLARMADVAVNDAFGTAHRAHASNVGVAALIKPAVAGLLMAAEIDAFNRTMGQPERPVAAILGGSKVSTKIGVIASLTGKVDHIFIGGGMAFTFIKALGGSVGNSLVEEEMQETARQAMAAAKARGVGFHLPVDAVITRNLEDASEVRTVPADAIPDGWMGLDVGMATVERFQRHLADARTILWNGPPGVFENPAFAKGTLLLAQAVARSSALTVIGGGDTAAAVHQAGVAGEMNHISTGGGAFLEMLEGKKLPGVTCLNNA